MTEYKRLSETTAHVELIIDGVSKGIFTTLKMAKEFEKTIDSSSISDIVINEACPVSGKADQKSDEVIIKRRGRPKVGKNERNFVS